MISFRRRSPALELMDQPERVSREEMVGALTGLRRVNRWLGGIGPTVAALEPILRRAMADRPATLRLCDVGCGAGDVAIGIVKSARRRRLPICIVAVELNGDLAAEARRATARFPEIIVLHADARDILRSASSGRGRATSGAPSRAPLPAVAEPFHAVYCSLFLHHFPAGEVVDWLSLMAGAATHGVVVNDLERHIAAWLGIKAIGGLVTRNRVFHHDAPLSVRRAYTPAEWRSMVARAGLKGARLQRRWAWRVLVSWERRSPDRLAPRLASR